MTDDGILNLLMKEDLRIILLAAGITIAILVVNLAVGATSVKASQRMKSWSGVSTNSAMFERENEVVEKVKEYLPKKNVDYRRVVGRD